jgi:hypothetical protein
MSLNYHILVIRTNLVCFVYVEFTFGNSQASKFTQLGENKLNPNTNYIDFKESPISPNIEYLSTSRKNEIEIILDEKDEKKVENASNQKVDKLDDNKKGLSNRLNKAKLLDNPSQPHAVLEKDRRPKSTPKKIAPNIKSKLDLLENIIKGCIS